MLVELQNTVQRLTRKPIASQSISGGAFRFPVRIAEAFPFLAKLCPNDLARFKQRATFSIDNPNQDERSIVIPLEKPIEVEGRIILALRLKGLFPRSAKNGTVQTYIKGNGFVEKLHKVVGKDLICSNKTRDNSEYSAQGTMRFTELKTEVETALLLGPKKTDFMLGFGIFDGMDFDGQPVGFAIYGMESKEKLRVSRYFDIIVKETGSLAGIQEVAKDTGILLRAMHRLNLAHRFPHLGNFGLSAEKGCRILDLDTAVSLQSIPAEWRPAMLYLDLSRTINDYMRAVRFEDCYDGETILTDIYLTPLIPFFLQGYFCGDSGLQFVERLERYTAPGASEGELFRTFGYLPEFNCEWRLGGDDWTLMEPIIQALLLSPKPVNLKDPHFIKNPLYADFYAALEATSLRVTLFSGTS